LSFCDKGGGVRGRRGARHSRRVRPCSVGQRSCGREGLLVCAAWSAAALFADT
jgi:hypothetical protein